MQPHPELAGVGPAHRPGQGARGGDLARAVALTLTLPLALPLLLGLTLPRLTGGAVGGRVGERALAVGGAALGAGAGALSGKLADYGIDDDFIRSIGETLQPNTSALFVLLRKVQPEKVLDELKRFRGRVLRSSLSPEQEARLQAALSGSDVSMPGTTSTTPETTSPPPSDTSATPSTAPAKGAVS